MPPAHQEKEFVSYVVDLMQTIGPVYARGMFGGHGIFLEGLMFGLVANGILYLKADRDTENEFMTRNLQAFTYNRKGQTLSMSYYQAPGEALEDAGDMKRWAGMAWSAATRAASGKPRK